MLLHSHWLLVITSFLQEAYLGNGAVKHSTSCCLDPGRTHTSILSGEHFHYTAKWPSVANHVILYNKY